MCRCKISWWYNPTERQPAVCGQEKTSHTERPPPAAGCECVSSSASCITQTCIISIIVCLLPGTKKYISLTHSFTFAAENMPAAFCTFRLLQHDFQASSWKNKFIKVASLSLRACDRWACFHVMWHQVKLGDDLLVARTRIIRQLKVPELHCLVCTSGDKPPLGNTHKQKIPQNRKSLLWSNGTGTFRKKKMLKNKPANHVLPAAGFTWSGARQRDHRAPSWASNVSRRLPEASSKICSFPLWQEEKNNN